MPKDLLVQYRPDFQEVLNHLRDELSTVRAGRANPQIVERIMVEAYGAPTELKGVASIMVPDARTILIEPWDKSLVKEIEKGIQEAKIGLNPTIQGNAVRIAIPPMTEENRKQLIKIMNEKLEHGRVGVRNVREKIRADIVKAEKDKEITEDEKYKLLEQVDKTAAGFNDQIKKMGTEKEEEIMTI